MQQWMSCWGGYSVNEKQERQVSQGYIYRETSVKAEAEAEKSVKLVQAAGQKVIQTEI